MSTDRYPSFACENVPNTSFAVGREVNNNITSLPYIKPDFAYSPRAVLKENGGFSLVHQTPVKEEVKKEVPPAPKKQKSRMCITTVRVVGPHGTLYPLGLKVFSRFDLKKFSISQMLGNDDYVMEFTLSEEASWHFSSVDQIQKMVLEKDVKVDITNQIF